MSSEPKDASDRPFSQASGLMKGSSKRSFASRAGRSFASIHLARAAGQDALEKDEDGSNVAIAMWYGMLLDSIPESLMLGFMTCSDSITNAFLLAIFIANFPEAFSAAAIMREQGLSRRRIFCMWALIFVITGVMAAVGVMSMPSNVTPGSRTALLRDQVGASIEGHAGGLMMAMIATAMLPEALHGAGQISGLFFVLGFVSIALISATGVSQF